MFPFPTVVAMDVAQQASAQVRVEERYRGGNDVKSEETEVAPQLRYDFIWKGGQNHFVATYSPRILYTDVFSVPSVDTTLVNPATLSTYEDDGHGGVKKSDPNKNPFSFLQNGGVGFEAVRSRYRVSLYGFGAYGPITTTALLIQPSWSGDGFPVDPNPIIPSTISARFTLLFAQLQLFVPIRITRRVALTPGFVYNAFGGADAVSRGAIALTSGPGANLALDVAATRSDRFVTTIGAGRVSTRFQDDRTGATIYRAEATQSWRHWYTPHVSTEISGGATFGGDDINGFSIYSLASAGLLYDSYGLAQIAPGAPLEGAIVGRGNRLQIGLVGKIAPWVDLFSGGFEQRGAGVLAANYTITRTTLRAQVSTASVFNTPESVAQYNIAEGEASALYRITTTLSAELGLRYGHQRFDNAIRFNDLSQGTVFGSLAWAPLPARF